MKYNALVWRDAISSPNILLNFLLSGENLPLRRTFEISGETGGFTVLWLPPPEYKSFNKKLAGEGAGGHVQGGAGLA